jgi:hypothetical protein
MKELVEDVIEYLIDKENRIKEEVDEIIYQQGSPLSERIKPLNYKNIEDIEKLRKKYQNCEDLIQYCELNWREELNEGNR